MNTNSFTTYHCLLIHHTYHVSYLGQETFNIPERQHKQSLSLDRCPIYTLGIEQDQCQNWFGS